MRRFAEASLGAFTMNTHDPNQPSIGDSNVERLLGKAYQPEQPDTALLPRVSEQMCSAASMPRPASSSRPVLTAGVKARDYRLLPILTGMAVALAGLLLVTHAMFPPHRSGR